MKDTGFIGTFSTKLKSVYALDARALSLMRVLISGLLITDLIIRATSLTAFYTGEGVTPFETVERAFWQDGYFSLFQFSDAYWFVSLLFLLTGIIYFFLLIGYRTRIFTILAWVMLVSLQNRNHAILQCGDDELRLILFWGIFLPWGNFYSLDGRRNPSLQTEAKYFGIAGVAYVLLIFSVYFFTGVLKTSAEWDLREGTAYYYALNLDQMALPAGKSLLNHPGLLKLLTVAAKWLEIGIPFLLLIPYRNSRLRTIVVVILSGFHIAIALTLYVGLFYLISIFSLVGLLGPRVMNKFERYLNVRQDGSLSLDRLAPSWPANFYLRMIVNCFVFFCMALCLIWNLGSVEWSGLRVSDRAFRFGYTLRLDQRWNMFAPAVLKDDGWIVTDAVTKDGKHIDIYRNGERVYFEKPANVLKYIRDDRWRKYQENLMFSDNSFMRDYYCRYLVREWNASHSYEEVDSVSAWFVHELTPPPGGKTSTHTELICKCGK